MPSAGGPAADAALPGLRWRNVLRGDEAQIRELRRWIATLLPESDARADVVTVAVELATNAIQHTASGHGGLLVTEITWHPTAVRIAVADGGAPQPPRLIEDPLAEHGRGLQLVHGLSARMGTSGDHRGRLVWADVPWAGHDVTAPASLPPGYEAAIRDGHAELARCHGGTLTWFGNATQQWWALTPQPPTGSLVAADSPHELAGLLDELATTPSARAWPTAASAARRLDPSRAHSATQGPA